MKRITYSPHQVNIICVRAKENQSRLRNSLGGRFHIGKVPKKTEPNKVFTFCTRTAYLSENEVLKYVKESDGIYYLNDKEYCVLLDSKEYDN